MTRQILLVAAAAALSAACVKRVHEEPIIENGDRVRSADETVARHREVNEPEVAALESARDSIAAVALASCAGPTCEAIARGEVALGMNEAQVMAATRTTPAAWSVRYAGPATVMVPRGTDLPRDAAGPVAIVQLRDGNVRSYSYREAQGVRVVDAPADATTEGRAAQLADMLVREGDDLAAAGEFTAALNRYDRAQILKANDPLVDYKIAASLDKQLRPIEALLRYRLFLHRLELEKIDAVGRAYGHLADAIAHARERIIVLEKR